MPGRRRAGERVQKAGQQCSGTVGTLYSFLPVTTDSRSVEKTATDGHQSDFPVISVIFFGPPGSGFVGQRYGSGSRSIYHKAKIVRKNFDSYYFLTSL